MTPCRPVCGSEVTLLLVMLKGVSDVSDGWMVAVVSVAGGWSRVVKIEEPAAGVELALRIGTMEVVTCMSHAHGWCLGTAKGMSGGYVHTVCE